MVVVLLALSDKTDAMLRSSRAAIDRFAAYYVRRASRCATDATEGVGFKATMD
jgi:hypothetical protein